MLVPCYFCFQSTCSICGTLGEKRLTNFRGGGARPPPPQYANVLGISMFMGLLEMSVSGGLSSKYTICVSWVASFMSVSLWFVIALLRSM